MSVFTLQTQNDLQQRTGRGIREAEPQRAGLVEGADHLEPLRTSQFRRLMAIRHVTRPRTTGDGRPWVEKEQPP